MKETLRTARWTFVCAFFAYVLTGGGRIVGSDEVTMLELSRAMLHGRLDVPAGATLDGPDGRHYTKNAAGQAVLALPLVAAAEGMAAASGLPEARRTLAVRFVTSFFNAVVTALLLAVFYATARALEVRAPAALAATLLLGFTTPLWPYAKSFMAEPLQGLGLVLALAGSARAEDPRARVLGALGVFLAISVKVSMLPIALLCAAPLIVARPPRDWIPLVAALAFALAGYLLYDFLCFHDPLQTGYGRQASPAAFTTPLFVGLYGLLLSSGKGVLWFAPALWAAAAGWRAMWGRPPCARRAALSALAAWIAGLLLYGSFEHWAGDGSFGPRYLVPLLPLAFLAVAFAIDRASRRGRQLVWALGLAGLMVQIGGVSIHFGAEMREVGDYPYTRALSDPHFMSESHFNPAFSPILGHWRMLARNVREHVEGRAPRLTGEGASDPRVGASEADQARLLHALDYWWLYMIYAGLPAWPVAMAALLVLAATLLSARRLRAAALVEARAA